MIPFSINPLFVITGEPHHGLSIVTDEGLFKFGVADLIASYLTEAGVASHIFP
ncbi:hypothetical protein IAF32_04105, partial [Acinetobacter baumannii]|nr:hypothetical protein [Acinetobacter baumannii]